MRGGSGYGKFQKFVWGMSISGSPPGTLATQTADLTILGTVNLSSGTTISSTDGTLTFGQGLSVNGGTLEFTEQHPCCWQQFQ